MNNVELYTEILKQEVKDFVDFLKTKSKSKPKIAKGLFTIDDDFDKPLYDFKEYM